MPLQVRALLFSFRPSARWDPGDIVAEFSLVFPNFDVAQHLTITSISLHCIGPWRGVSMPKETLVKVSVRLPDLSAESGRI
ncbi:hypothetical protein ARMSODRAFT_58157 [Armillaria solidipes]|uniref:Uncharacterized protein n=1 Tax=Armillaria solidipes TaxID=1076256 RepID=A0A2H3CRT9_9AGAR|nr:hypothetical protein ARMSODRAFT_58157 [Armillaria solidipes]